MSGTVKEYIDSFIMDVNRVINWKYLKSSRVLKKQVKDLVFEINFFSSKHNNCSYIGIRSECHIWCRSYDKFSTIDSGIAIIPFRTDDDYWWDITNEKDREKICLSIIEEIQTNVLPFVEELEKDDRGGLLKLIYRYGFYAFSNSMRLIDETLGREEALRAAKEYSMNFSTMEKNILKRFAEGECSLINEKNLNYMFENHLITI